MWFKDADVVGVVIISSAGSVLVGNRCPKDHPVVRAYPKHFQPLRDEPKAAGPER